MGMESADIRWKQRYQNFERALSQLAEAHALAQTRALSKLEKQGVIQAFEYTYELAWNTLKDLLTYQGIVNLIGSRDAIREAFARGLIADGEGWMQMLADRNRTTHTYNEQTAEEIVSRIHGQYIELLTVLHSTLAPLAAGT